jgi:hypothetical protein
MDFCLVIFSHSDYSYLWPIIDESLKKNNLDDLYTIFLCNKTDKPKPECFKEYIDYDENLCYSKRWTNTILPKITQKSLH